MIVSFTGTSQGMNSTQESNLCRELIRLQVVSLDDSRILLGIHGDCVGADAQFHDICLELGIAIEIHPCTIEKMRAYCKGARKVYDPIKPLDRNKVMVERAERTLATPATDFETPRGGTWHSIRHAKKLSRPLTIFLPSGEIEIY